jgi:hypothetical protein
MEIGHQNEAIAGRASSGEVLAELATQVAHGRCTALRADVAVLELEDGPARSDKTVSLRSRLDQGRCIFGVDGPIWDDNALGDLGDDRAPEALRERPPNEHAAETHERRWPGVSREVFDVLGFDWLSENCFPHGNLSIAWGTALTLDPRLPPAGFWHYGWKAELSSEQSHC